MHIYIQLLIIIRKYSKSSITIFYGLVALFEKWSGNKNDKSNIHSSTFNKYNSVNINTTPVL